MAGSPRFVFASDSFKGTLTSADAARLLEAAARRHVPGCACVAVPMADGGDGTVEALVAACGGDLRRVCVADPLGRPVEAAYGMLPDGRAIIEMAAASGLPLLAPGEKNPLLTSTYGTGELIRAALDAGALDVTLAIGGSATNDGGMGAMTALGVKFLDEDGNVLTGVGADLERVADIDVSGIHPAVKETEFTVMCDVNNPLTGPTGATYTFGKQKGGTPEILDRLEAGMKHYAAVIQEKLGVDADHFEGAGAAGGLGAAFKVFLKANMKSGIETVLDLIDFDGLLEGVDLVVTGEGRIDWQSAFGKVPSGIGMRCKRKGIPAVAIVGGMGDGAEKIYDFGVESILPTINGAMDIKEALDRAVELYSGAADRMFRMLKVGMSLK